MRRRRVLAAALLAVVASRFLAAGPVAAHGGDHVVYQDPAGPYFVEAINSVTDRGILYTIYLRDLNGGVPVDDATVQVTARSGATTVGPTDATRSGNAYRILIEDDGVSHWDIDARIEGGSGVATLQHQLDGAEHAAAGASDAVPWWIAGPALAVGLPLIGLYLFARYRRRPPAPGASVGPAATSLAATGGTSVSVTARPAARRGGASDGGRRRSRRRRR